MTAGFASIVHCVRPCRDAVNRVSTLSVLVITRFRLPRCRALCPLKPFRARRNVWRQDFAGGARLTLFCEATTIHHAERRCLFFFLLFTHCPNLPTRTRIH